MTEVDWRQRGGKMTEFKPLPPLNLNNQHTFALTKVEVRDQQQTKFGLKNKVLFTWQECGVPKEQAHRVWYNCNESYTEKSSLIKFLQLVSGKKIVGAVEDVKLGDFVELGIEIVSLVKPRIDKEGKLTTYYDFIMESIRPAAAAKQAPIGKPAGVEQIKLLIKGSADKDTAMISLLDASQSSETIQTFLTMVRNGIITFPA